MKILKNTLTNNFFADFYFLNKNNSFTTLEPVILNNYNLHKNVFLVLPNL